MGFRGRLAAVAVIASVGGQAGAACWSDAELAAARVRDMQTMLMVATLRCRAAGIDISADYNAFVRARRGGIEGVNGRLKAHFWAAGPVDGQRAYDRFTTQLANAYGSGDTGPESCAEAAAMSRAAALLTDESEALDRMAADRVLMPALAADRCVAPLAGGGTVIAAR